MVRLERAKKSLDHQINVIAHSKTTEMKKKMKYNSPPPQMRPRVLQSNGSIPYQQNSRQPTTHKYIAPHQRTEDQWNNPEDRKLSQVERNCAPFGDGVRVAWRLIERQDRSGHMTHFWWDRETNQTTFNEPKQWGYHSPDAISSDSEVELCPTSDDESYSQDQKPIVVDQTPMVENLYKDLPKMPTTTCTEESYTTDLSATISDHDDSFREREKKAQASRTPPPPPPLKQKQPNHLMAGLFTGIKPLPEKRKKTRFDHAPPTEHQKVKIELAKPEDRPVPVKTPYLWRPATPETTNSSPKRSRSRSREKSSHGRFRMHSSVDRSSRAASSSRRRRKRSSSKRKRNGSRSKSRGRSSRSSRSRSRGKRRRRGSGSRSHRRSPSSRSLSDSRASSRSYTPERDRSRKRKRRKRSPSKSRRRRRDSHESNRRRRDKRKKRYYRD